jgi:hypothetical protein
LLTLASVGVAAMVLGDVMTLVFARTDNEAVHSELIALKRDHQLTDRDFVLTRYGVNPICNWFLGTPSGLITAFNSDDFGKFDRMFVLNPAEGSMLDPRADLTGSGASDEKRAYWMMRRNITLPDDLDPIFESEQMSVYRLETIPAEWEFDERGRWQAPAVPVR